jgi:HEAT repeat protein
VVHWLKVRGYIRQLRHKDATKRRDAAAALGQLGDTRAVEPLILASQGLFDTDVVAAAIEALGQLGDGRAVKPLLAHSSNPYQNGQRLYTLAWQGLLKLGVCAVEPLIAALQDSPAGIRSRAAWVLGQLGDARAVAPLIAALQDSNDEVRSQAVWALGKLGDARAVEPLIAALEDLDQHVRDAAASALGQLGDARAVEPLIAALQDSNSNVRSAAGVALGELGDTRAVGPLIAALRDDSVRSSAMTALGQLGDARAVVPLIGLIKHSAWNVRKAAAEALGQLGNARAVEPLGGRLTDSDWHVQIAAAEALGQLGDSRAIEPLVAMLRKEHHNNVPEAAAKTLACLCKSASETQLQNILALRDVRGFKWTDHDCAPSTQHSYVVDISDLRQTARQELVRRESGRPIQAPATPPVAAQAAPTISFACSHCQKKFRVAAKHAGRQTPCPACQRQIAIPMK